MSPRSEVFENLPERYDAWFERHPEAYAAELRALQIVLRPFHRGLEVGVGSGRFAQPLGFAWGVDPAMALLVKAKGRGLRVILGTAEHLPFLTASMDAVLMVTTLCFVDDLARSFQEIHRVLRQDGHLYLGYVDRDSWLGQRYLQEKEGNPFYREATFVSTPEILTLLRKTGFVPEDILQTLLPSEGSPYGSPAVENGFGQGGFVALRARKV